MVTPRLWIALVGVAILAACNDGTDPADPIANLAGGTAELSTSAHDNRIRFDPRHRPVFVAPDGSRRLIASMLAPPRRMTFGASVWDDPSPGTGPIWIRVDLSRQLLSVFRGANEIGTAVIIYGTDGKETPLGTFALLGKERMHHSSLYDADMPFTLWLTDDGVAIHASAVERGRATHGCIGVPADFASRLFAVARRGDAVIVLPLTNSS